MIGMDFISFLILLVISVVVSGILHYGLNYYVTPGFWSFCSKVAVGWLGAWIGSPVIGHWPPAYPVSTTEMFGLSRQSSAQQACSSWPLISV